MTNPKSTPHSNVDRKDLNADDLNVDVLQLRKKPFRYFMRKHPRAFILGSVTLIITDFLGTLTPLAKRAGIDAIMQKDQSALVSAIGIYVALMTGVLIFRYGWRIYFGRFHHAVADDLRNRIFSKLTELGPSFYQRSNVGQLMSLITNDVNSFRMAIGPGVLTFIDCSVLILMTVPLMCWLSFDWTWKTLIFVPIIPFFMRRMERIIHERYRFEQDRLADVSAKSQEIVSGIRVIKSFAQEKNQIESFNRLSKTYELACNGVARADAYFGPVMRLTIAVGSVILLWWGTSDVIRGTITLGTLVAFQEYIQRMCWPVSGIGVSISMIEQGRASFDRIDELIATETDIPDFGTSDLGEFESLELRDLTFRYPGATVDAIADVNLTIRKGETIGLVGPVGAGKTTLLQLITRLYPTKPGAVLINGISVADIKRKSLSRTVSYVTQDVLLFSETVAENVALGVPVFPGLEPIEEAATLVNIHQEIHSLPEKYDAYLGERGVNLSGGQKQRLSIARAVIREATLVMLDDSLSAVDGKTEKLITNELREAKKERTVILVSHRLATLKHADRIIVMNHGRIEAIGPHDELIKTCPTYCRLNELQTSQSRAATHGRGATDAALSGGTV